MFGILITACTTLGIRLYNLQIVNGDHYSQLSDKNRIKTFYIPASRGLILDTNGTALAKNTSQYDLICNPKKISNIKKLLKELQKALTLSDQEIQSIESDIMNNYKRELITLYTNISFDTISSIEFNSMYLENIRIIQTPVRYYNFGPLCSHIVGYVQKEKDSTSSRKNYFTGKAGMELVYNDKITGTPQIVFSEFNAHGKNIRNIKKIEEIPGENIQLSLDINLQKFAMDLLEKKIGAIVVLDIKTGKIVSMCSSPSFDNNTLNSITQANWDSLSTDKSAPFINRAITWQINPASTFKIITALAALNADIIEPTTEFTCKGYITIGNEKFRCWKKHGHGKINLLNAITQSCNSYFYEIGKRIDIEKIAEMAIKFGFGQHLLDNFPEEQSGIIPTTEWLQKQNIDQWYLGDTINATIGHGYVHATPIQLATMIARLASNKIVIPSFLKDDNDPNFSKLNVPGLAFIKSALFKVVNSKKGTAYSPDIFPGQVAGKTGTISSKSSAGDGIFTGFAPFNDPQYAVSVVIQKGRSGRRCGEIAQKILKYLLK